MITFQNASQGFEEYLEERQRLSRLIYETKDGIVLNVRCEYFIHKSNINTAEKILRWAVHLSQKTWMTKELVHYFILMACHIANIKAYGI
jgi:hypothetical protein